MELPTHSSKRTNQKAIFFLLIGLLGLVYLALGYYIYYQKRVLSFSGTIPEVQANQNEYFDPVQISFKKQNLTIPVVTSKIENGVWEISDNSASYLGTSAKPGEGGNIVIYGHNKRKILGPIIKNIKKGDEIAISTEEKTFSYVVSEVFEVTPDKIEVVYPTDFEVLTVYTCTGPFDSKRYIVKALPAVNLD